MEKNINLYSSLPDKELECKHLHVKRILKLDPTSIYERIKDVLNPLSRYNKDITFDILFPQKNDGLCDCGCETPLNGRKTRWASTECMNYAVGVWQVIAGKTDYIAWVLSNYQEPICAVCGIQPCEADHIVPVNQGGGGSWLSNFQFLCKEHHKEKTRRDNGWKKMKTKEERQKELASQGRPILINRKKS